jgi:tetratricopeptide (TPR) repeat protein/tRNA A-37 threonylcarbamoyl transferase component Bud32
MKETLDRPDGLGPDQLHQIDRRCDAFEAALRAGMRPRLEDYLDGIDEPARAVLLAELRALEQDGKVRPSPPTSPSGSFAPLPGFSESEPPAVSFGDYELIEKVGQGGMGEVFRARQLTAGRVVALKIIRRDRLADLPEPRRLEWVERFLNEARAAARLDHENIVPVYDVGEYGGRHFYSMRFVAGKSLADLLDAPMLPRRAAEIIEAVARAVQHAHDRGVLHRDLKPRNVLIDEGRPLVVDFGLAKWLPGDAELTSTGALLGSPPYAAPEQLRHAATVGFAADVYGLGATLYHLLARRAPFPSPGSEAPLLEQILNDPPAPLWALRGHDRDLETICLKCLEKEPHRRYASAAELADDLRRYLGGEPIRARRAGPVERARKWARRHPLRVALVVLSVCFVLAGVAGSLVYVRHLGQERDRAESERDNAVQFGRDATRSLQDVVDHVQGEWGDHIPELSESVGKNVLERLDATEARLSEAGRTNRALLLILARLRRLRADAEVLLGQMDKALADYERTLESYDGLPDGTEATQDRAACLHNLGTLQSKRERHAEAERALKEALSLRQRLTDNDPSPQRIGDLASTHYALGALCARTARQAEAARHYEEARRRQEELVRQYPDSSRFRQDLARTANNQGILASKTGELKAARSAFERSVALQGVLMERHPRVFAYERYRARAQHNLASVLEALGENRRAREHFREALASFERGHLLYPQIPDYAQELAAAYLSVAAFKEATEPDNVAVIAKTYRAAVSLREKLVEDHPSEDQYQAKLALARKAYGDFLLAQGKLVESEQQFRAALEATEELCRRLPDVLDYRDDRANVQNSLARALRARALDPATAASAVASFAQALTLLTARQILHQEALRTAGEALAGHEALRHANPRNNYYRRNLGLDLLLVAQLRADLGEHAQAIAAARSYRELGTADAVDLLEAAALWCGHATRQRGHAAYEAEAIACLRAALSRGADRAALRRRAFDPIRGNAEFKALLAGTQ